METLIHGDCLERLKEIPDNSIDSIVTDPPYGLSFMGKKWDYDVPSIEIWKECLRVLKPGGHLLSFAGTRTQHRMAVRIEDAGFEIRDMIAWVYGSGFPKSLNIGKAVRAMQETGGSSPRNLRKSRMGDDYKPTGQEDYRKGRMFSSEIENDNHTEEIDNEWKGWGTALKPSHEDITVARKPLYSSGDCAIMAQKIIAYICQLPSVARIVEKTLASSQNELGEGVGIARWIVGDSTSTLAVLSGLTDMLRSESEKTSSLNTELSWLNTLADLLKNESMFTTETKTSLIIDLKILNSLLSKITQSTTTKDETKPNGEDTNASLVKHTFSVFGLKLKTIQEHFVGESAISRAGEQDLRPSLEPITVARKPLIGTVAENVLTHGTGGLNIDGSRVGTEERTYSGMSANTPAVGTFRDDSWVPKDIGDITVQGRWPANLLHDGSEEVLECFPQSETHAMSRKGNKFGGVFGSGGQVTTPNLVSSSGSAARFFYCAKASKKDRDEGLEGFEEKQQDESRIEGNPGGDNPRNRGVNKVRNFHPTVKPTELMRYLVKLVTPPGGTVLDPFTGSGSTGKACKLEGFDFIGIEREEEYVKIARARIEAVSYTPTLL